MLTLVENRGILDKLPLESEIEKQLNKNFKKVLKKVLTKIAFDGNI